MKVYIGPYPNWWGPYQIADLLQYVGVSEDTCYDIGNWLSNTWVGNFLQWIHDKKKRKIKVQIDRYDAWSAHHTLALVILPVLQSLKQHKLGSGFVDDVDVPEHIRSTADPDYKPDAWGSDKYVHDRWDYALNEMIYAFEQELSDDPDVEYNEIIQTRVRNGLKLFGTYYQTLWD